MQKAACRLQIFDELVLVHVLHVDLAIQSSVQHNVHIQHCFAAGSVKSSPSYDQSVLNLSLVASCLHSLLALHCLLCFCSHHGPLIVRIARLLHHVKVPLSSCILFDVHDRCRKWSVSVPVSFIFIFISDVASIQVVECGVHGQHRIPILHICNVVDWLRSHICTNFRCRYPFDSEIAILNSFLYPEGSCINVFRPRSCTQAICQRVCSGTVALYVNFHWNSQIHVCGPQK